MNIEKNIQADVNDASVEYYRANGNGVINIAGFYAAGTGTITFKKRILNQTRDMLDATDSAIAFTASFNRTLTLGEDEVFGFGITGATGLQLHVKINGDFTKL